MGVDVSVDGAVCTMPSFCSHGPPGLEADQNEQRRLFQGCCQWISKFQGVLRFHCMRTYNRIVPSTMLCEADGATDLHQKGTVSDSS